MLKAITHPTTGVAYKMGRRQPMHAAMHPKLAAYLYSSLPAPPDSCDYTPRAMTALSNVYGNDELGDCTIAGVGHLVGLFTANAGQPVIFSRGQIVSMYSACGGYVVGDESTDQGCDENVVLSHWRDHGGPDGAHPIVGFLSVDATNPQEYRTAQWLFENLYFGVAMPDAWVSPMPEKSGFVWDKAGAPDPANGHCFVGCGYSPRGVAISTWGMLGTITDAAIAEYASASAGGQMFTVISRDIVDRACDKAPSGFNWAQLAADFDALGGKV